MIQDIQPNTFSNTFIANPNIKTNDYIFHFSENKLLLKQNGNAYEIPQRKDFEGSVSDEIFLFSLNNTNCFLTWKCDAPNNGNYAFHEISFLRNINQKEIDWSASVAFHLMNWYTLNKFCGKCGKPTIPTKNERSLICPSCQRNLYPRISPAIIVAIRSTNKLLLARNANFQNGMFSLVAGYIDIGESIEDAVKREVKEEVGLDIENIRYYGSQPWPFSGSIMIGFIADGNEQQPIKVDNNEIVEAAWFTSENLPNRPPNRSIAGEIIDKFVNNEL